MRKLYHPGRPCNTLLEDAPLRLEDLGEKLEIVQCSDGFGVFSDDQFWISNKEFEDNAHVLAKSKIFFTKNKFDGIGWFFYSPIELEVELTRDCNQECIHCWNDSNRQGSLDFSLAKRIVDEFRSYGGQKIKIAGGEPLKYSSLEDFLVYCKSKGVKTLEMTSNGSLITAREAGFLANNLSSISLSIHGSSPDIHDLITNSKGSFERAVNAVQLLQKEGLNPKINYTIMQQNKKDVLNMLNFAQYLGVNGLKFICLKNVGRGLRLDSLTKQETQDLRLQIYDAARTSKICLERSELYPRGYKLEAGHFHFYGCNGLRSLAYISYNGTVFPCSLIDKPVGNLNTSPMFQIWRGKEATEFRSNGKYSCCQNSHCDLKVLCGGECRA